MDQSERLKKLRRLAALKAQVTPQNAKLPGPIAMPSPRPDASTQGPAPFQVGNLAGTLKTMGEGMNRPEQLGHGLMKSGERTARAIGIPQSLRAMGVNLDPDAGKGFEGVSEGTGGYDTAGDLAGTLGTAIPLGAGAVRALPAAIKNLGKKSPRLMAYLKAMGGAGASAAALTPGSMGERATQAAIAAPLAGLGTAAMRTLAKPVRMSELGRKLYGATGEIPPVSVGAESKLIQDTGNVLKGIPLVGHPVAQGERRLLNASVRQLWEHATPPGKSVLLPKGTNVERGGLFIDLDTQFDEAYTGFLKGQRIPVGGADRKAITKLIDKSLVSEDAAKAHLIVGKYFPEHSGVIKGTKWKELQTHIRQNANKMQSSTMRSEQMIGEALSDVDKHLMKMRNRSLPRGIAKGLDDTDTAYSYRMLLEKAISKSGGGDELSPSHLGSALRSRTGERTLAQGRGTGQHIIDPLNAALGSMGEGNTPQALWQMRRLMDPAAAVGIGAAGAMAGGPAALLAMLPAGAVGANLLGGTKRGARVLFGETETQKYLASLLKRHGSVFPSAVGGLSSRKDIEE